MHANRLHGSNEAGTLADARKIKAINPDAKVLFYWNLFLDYSNYEASENRNASPSWFLKNADGTPSLKGNSNLRRYDLTDPEFQKWWVSVAAQMIADPAIDGVFVDALPQVAGNPQNAAKSWGEDKAIALDAGINDIFKALREDIGDDGLIIYNGIRSVKNGWPHGGLKYLEHADGLMVEHFGKFASAETAQIEADLDLMIQAASQGKVVALKGFPDFTWLEKDTMKLPHDELINRSKRHIDFPLAAFLVSAGEQSFFNYSWGYRAHMGNLDWYPEFNKRLGPPLGPAVKSKHIYTRQFEHADVRLDSKNKTANIVRK